MRDIFLKDVIHNTDLFLQNLLHLHIQFSKIGQVCLVYCVIFFSLNSFQFLFIKIKIEIKN
jgi:hypothetical protein